MRRNSPAHGSRRDLISGDLVAASIDGVKKGLRQIDASAEELHLLAQPHRRDAARDAVVIAPERPHQIVVLVLQRGRVTADLDAIALERRGHARGRRARDPGLLLRLPVQQFHCTDGGPVAGRDEAFRYRATVCVQGACGKRGAVRPDFSWSNLQTRVMGYR